MNGSENGRGSASSLITRATREPRARSSVSWNEFLPRYLLIEEALSKRNVLEVGTIDIRSLIKLHDAGASRVLGVSTDPSRFDRSLLRGRAIDVLRMDSGRLDFGDTAFDAILVVDLARELAHNPSFLVEVRRILRPEGYCVLGYSASGRSLVELIDDDPKVLAFEPHELEAAVRAVFPDARFYLQSPFVGVTIHPQGLDPSKADVSLDPSLGTAPRPSHVIALCGRAPDAAFRTLVELPFVAFEAMTEAAQERSQSDLTRLLDALRSAREQIAVRDRSLEAIKKRLPKIREAILSSRQASTVEPSEAVPSPTILDRPTDDGRRVAELEARIQSLDAALEEERERRLALEARPAPDYAADLDRDTIFQSNQISVLERELFEREQEKMRLEAEIVALRTRELERASETAMLAARVRQLEASREDVYGASLEREEQQAELQEARRRITHLERTASLQEQEIDDLRRELENQSVVRYSLGDGFRDAEARIAFLSSRIEDLALGHAQEMKRAEERILFLADALSTSDQEREALRARLDELEGGALELSERAERTEHQHRYLTEELEAERAEHYQIRGHFDDLRLELLEKSNAIDQLERALSDRDAEIALLKKSQSSAGADRKAVELAAAHLSREVEQLRKRVQELRNERDTLAATSTLLLQERDTAAQLAKQVVEAEERAAQLQLSLEGGHEAIERLERELDEARAERERIERRYFETEERARMLERDLERHRASTEVANGRLGEQQTRHRELDKKLAELADRVNAAEAMRDRVIRDKEKLEEMLLEAHSETANASRDVRRLEERITQLAEHEKNAEQEMGRILADRAQAEAEVMRARAVADDYRGKNALLVAEVADLERQLHDVRSDRQKLLRVTRELEQTEIALSKTLSEAAGLDARLKELERLVEAGERERIQIELQRQAAEASRRSAEAARAHAVAEVRALSAERAQLIARFEAELHASREQIRELEKNESFQQRIRELEEERLALMVWAEELEISRQLAEANAERLRTDSARHQVASEEARIGLIDAENQRLQQALVVLRGELLERSDEIDLLELQNAELVDRLAAARAERLRLGEEAGDRIEHLTALVEEARLERGAAVSRAREAERELADLAERLAVAERRSGELADELLEVSAALDPARRELVALKGALTEAQSAAERAERRAAELERAASDVQQLRAQLAETARRIALLEDAEREAVELRGELAGVQAEVADLRSKHEAAVAELGWSHSEAAALRSQLHGTSTRAAELEAEVAGARQRIATLESSAREATETAAQLAKMERRAGELQSALAGAELKAAGSEAAAREAAELRSKLQEAHRRSAELEEALEQARQSPPSYEERTLRAEQQVARLEGQLAREASAARDAETRARNAEVLARNSEDRANSAENRRRTAEVRALDAEAKAKHAERKLFETEQRVKQLESQLERESNVSTSASEGVIAPLRTRVETLEQALDEARAEVGRKLQELKTAREERAQAERELEEERQSRQATEAKLSRQGDADHLKEELDRRDHQIARFRADAASMQAEKNRLLALIQSSEQNQVQLERRIAELETALAESNQQLELLRRDLSERTERLRRLSSGINEPG